MPQRCHATNSPHSTQSDPYFLQREREFVIFISFICFSFSPKPFNYQKRLENRVRSLIFLSNSPARFVRVFHIYSRTCCRPFRIAKKDCNPPRQYGGNIARTCVIQLRRFQFQIRIRPIPVFYRLWIRYARNVTIEFFPFPLTDAHDALLPAAYLSYRIKTTNSSPPPSRFVSWSYISRGLCSQKWTRQPSASVGINNKITRLRD